MSRGFAMLEEGDYDGCLLVERQCVGFWGKILEL